MNKFLLSYVKFMKLIELLYIIIVTLGIWIYTPIVLIELPIEENYLYWGLYGFLVIVTLYHLLYNNICFNLRLAIKAKNFNTGKCCFDCIN